MSDTLDQATAALSGLTARRLRDPDLFERSLSGDPQAFAEVYRRYRLPVYGYCLARLNDRAAAEDAAQEVFVRLLSADASRIDNGKAWLYTVARNVCVDQVRRRRDATPIDTTGDGLVPEQMRQPDGSLPLLDAETAGHVVLALRRLLPRYRTALVMREIHGTSSVEIGAAMGMKPGAVDTLVSRARDALGRAYAEVSNLPPACRLATELMYKQTGTGITAAETTAMTAHLGGCPTCSAEYRRATDPRYLPAIVPMLLSGASARGIAGSHGVLFADASGPVQRGPERDDTVDVAA